MAAHRCPGYTRPAVGKKLALKITGKKEYKRKREDMGKGFPSGLALPARNIEVCHHFEVS